MAVSEKHEGRPRKVTIREVAAAAETTIGTVSLALRGSSRISRATRERVQRAADQLGYQPHLPARLLREQRPRRIGLIWKVGQEFHEVLLDRLHRLATAQDCELVTAGTSPAFGLGEAFSSLLSLRCQALILIDARPTPAMRKAYPDRGGIVLIGQSPPTGTTSVVTSANDTGMSEALAHLAGLGHRSIAYLEGPRGPSASARRDSFERAIAATGLHGLVLPGGNDISAGFESFNRHRDILARDAVTAAVCYNDQCAEGLVIAALKAGLRLPEDLSVIGTDDSTLARSSSLSLTSINKNPARLAELAFQAALVRLDPPGDAGEPPPARQVVDSYLVVRSSTAEPRRGQRSSAETSS
ncbi:MAG: LacI family DNA-binding transcriptional regulator [Propionibacteriaceae bacterium]|nr:LacI family DNA-binding transcriptional regulator [Propionibacteriaceae bacterium]